MTDPHGPPPPGRDQGARPPGADGYPETARYQPPGQAPGPYAGYGDGQYPNSAYPNAPYPNSAYPNAPYPNAAYPTSPYPNVPYPPQGGRAAGSGGARRTWIIIAAAVASVAIVAAVVVVLLLNRAPDPNRPFAQGASTAPLAIPDDVASGVVSPIVLAGEASVGRLDVVLTLQHPYPRELTAVLTAPSGREAVVFARSDVAGRLALSTADPASPLRNLLGGPVAGTWSLAVSDDVAVDSGTLQGWEITVFPAAADAPALAAERATGTSSPALAVPDDDPLTGATDTIDLPGYGTVERIAVDVAITHDISSDLLVELRSPQGTTVVLSDGEGGLGPAIRLALDSTQPGSPLAALVGEPLAGPWQLRVLDVTAVDIGTLDSWEVTVNG